MWLKKEKGSITLFVLVSMLFFSVLAISAYVITANELQGQNDELVQIKSAYEQDLGDKNLAELYDRLTERNSKCRRYISKCSYRIWKSSNQL